jgi:hypothetical protein
VLSLPEGLHGVHSRSALNRDLGSGGVRVGVKHGMLTSFSREVLL